MLPFHLKRYVVEQDYRRYTPVDQEVWRYIMRQLKAFLSEHAHPCYVEGLSKTGISTERIPDIREMSEKLEKFGWRAVPVSGFIPPAAFMELQALGYLPIASDMRTIDHLTYTPAPDIVHEAAGHAPILVDEAFAGYLKSYAQVARKAIIGAEDMKQYEAIRVLSDMKEDPASTPEQIRDAERALEEVTRSIKMLSEAAILGRMNWWTAEYGLIGSLENPRIFGAGLLSSLGEARACLAPKVKKIPLTIDCINYAYDITEQQPQLFVTPTFERLTEVLHELANTMAFKVGGSAGLEKARAARTVNTVELNSGIQISGKLERVLLDGQRPAYLQFKGPTQLSEEGRELAGHGTDYHAPGFGSPVGPLEGSSKCLSQMSDTELVALGIAPGRPAELRFATGARVRGRVLSTLRARDGRLQLISFADCTVTRASETLFEPTWGTFDMAVGSKVTSVFGGPADRLAYGETDDFAAKHIPRKTWPEHIQRKHGLYADVRDVRDALNANRINEADASSRLEKILSSLEASTGEWLLRLDLVELGERLPQTAWRARAESELRKISDENSNLRPLIEDGLKLTRQA